MNSREFEDILKQDIIIETDIDDAMEEEKLEEIILTVEVSHGKNNR